MFASTLPESIIKTLSIRIKEVQGVNLGQGIPSFETPKHIRAAARIALKEKGIGVYPNFLGTMELREAIAAKFNKKYKMNVTAREHVLVTVGAMEAVASSVLSLIDTGDRVGIVTPDYCNHFPVVMLGKGKIVEIPMQEGKRWSLDLLRIEKEAKKGLKLVIITNPNNPTGAVYNQAEIKRLVALSNKYGFWILSDETYAFLDYSHTFASLAEFWQESKRLLIVRSFSKEYAMTGWRVGYLITNAKARQIIAKTHDALVGCVPKISQRAAYAALTGSQDVVAEFVKTFTKRQALVCSLLDDLRDYVTYAAPQGAYYIFPKVIRKTDSMQLMEKLLHKAHVAVVPGLAFGKAGENHFRISFAVEDDVLRKGLAQIKQYLYSTR